MYPPKNIDNSSLSYQLGLYVGEHIVRYSLPTLSTDSLQGHQEQVVQVNEEDTEELHRLDRNWSENRNRSNGTKLFGVMLQFQNMLVEKYLKPTIEAYIDRLYDERLNMKQFKIGINTSLWGCDFSHYMVSDDEFLTHDDKANLSKIKLKLHISTNPYL